MYDITVKATDRCNFKCSYCTFSSEQGKARDLDLNRLAGFLKDFGKETKSITFSGGEPLLKFEEISSFLSKVKEIHPNIEFNIMTNGSILNEKIIRVLKEFNINLTVSIDGGKMAHDLNRVFASSGVGTYEGIYKNLKAINYPFRVAMTIHPTNCRTLFENFKEVLKLNPAQISFTPVVNSVKWSESELNELKKNMRKIVLLYNEEIKTSNLRLSLLDLINNLGEINTRQAACFERCGEHLYLDTDGMLYICGSCVFSEKTRKDGLIGNVFHDPPKLLQNKLKKLSRNKIMPCFEMSEYSIENQNKILSIFVDETNFLLSLMKNDAKSLEKFSDIMIGGPAENGGPANEPSRKMFIYITNKCNLKCNYCFLRKGSKTIDTDLCKKAVELLIASKGSNKSLRFMGGEPLLELTLLKEAIDYARILESKHRKTLSIEIATNGILLNKEIIRYLEKRRVNLHLSIDGMPQTHSLNRTKDNLLFNKILSNIKMLQRSNIKAKYNMVVSPNTYDSLLENVKYLVSIGAKHISLEPAIGNYWSADDLMGLNRNLKILSRYYQQFLMKKGICLDCFDGISIFHYLIENRFFNKFFSFGCERHLTVNYNGDILNCPCYPDEKNQEYVLANLKDNTINEIQNTKGINQIYFQDANTNVLCSRHCLKVLVGDQKSQKESQELHKLGVIEPRFYHYKFMINYKPALFNRFAKERGFNPSLMYLNIMPHFIDGKKDGQFLKNNELINKKDLEVIDLNNNLPVKEIEILSQNKNSIFKGFIPLCRRKKLADDGRKAADSCLIPNSCVGCSYFFRIAGNNVVLCNGDSFNRADFSMSLALGSIKNTLRLETECKSCDYYASGKCFGVCNKNG